MPLAGAEGILCLDDGSNALITVTADDGKMLDLVTSDGSQHRIPRGLSIRRHVLKIFDDTIPKQETPA